VQITDVRPGAVVRAGEVALTPVAFTASDAVRAALAGIGRTEDIRFSPDNRRLAVAAFFANAVYVFGIAIDWTGDVPRVALGDFVAIRSPAFRHPHGVDYLDDSTLVVASRGGTVDIVRVPPLSSEGGAIACDPLRTIGWASLGHRIRSPGSVAVGRAGKGVAEILVCNNYRNRVTSHVFARRQPWSPAWNRVVLERGLAVPDGIAASPDGSWVAVSNHKSASVTIFGNRSGLRRGQEAVGTLHGVSYPHGLRFSPDGRRIYVADAGSPFVQLYESDGDWRGSRAPARSLAIIDPAAFHAGALSPEEGGPKGIDFDATGRLLVTTCENQPLAFFSLVGLPTASD
jgi:DNA-binding beta-propeller fold protein YncE